MRIYFKISFIIRVSFLFLYFLERLDSIFESFLLYFVLQFIRSDTSFLMFQSLFFNFKSNITCIDILCFSFSILSKISSCMSRVSRCLRDTSCTSHRSSITFRVETDCREWRTWRLYKVTGQDSSFFVSAVLLSTFILLFLL